MKLLKIAFAIVLFLAFPLSASAVTCSWTHASVPAGGSSASVVFSCTTSSGDVIAIKTLTARGYGSPSCGISVATGFYNTGTCDSPRFSTENPCKNPGAYYGTFWASHWDSHIDAINRLCGACGYITSPIWQPGGGEPQLRVSCGS